MVKKITLINSKQAKIGYQFRHVGESKDCKSCSLYNACIKNLSPNNIYEVIEVRNKVHHCPLSDGEVRIVEVRELPIDTLLESSTAFEGANIRMRIPQCSEIDCSFYDKCLDSRLIEGRKYKIVEFLGDTNIKCPNGKLLRQVILKPT